MRLAATGPVPRVIDQAGGDVAVRGNDGQVKSRDLNPAGRGLRTARLASSARATGDSMAVSSLPSLSRRRWRRDRWPGSRGSGGPEFLAWSAWASGASNGGSPSGGAAERVPASPGRLDAIGAGDRRLDAVTVCGQAAQQVGAVDQALGDHVDHQALLLHLAAHHHELGAEHDAAKALEHRRPHHQIGDPGLVLDGDEDDPARGAGALADQDQAGDLDPAAVVDLGQARRP